MTRLCVLGQGYVGLPLAIRACEAGRDVIGFDIDPDRVALINAATSPIEDVADDELAAALATGRFRATTDENDLVGFDTAVISVPTPLLKRVPSVAQIELACEILAPHLRPGCTVVLESTSYPGTTEEVVVPRLEQGSGLRAGSDFHVGFSPERIDPGNDRWTLATTPKLIAGIDAASLTAVREVFEGLVEELVEVSGTREAEFAKLLENTYRHVNIALVNEMAMFAHELDIDLRAVIDAAATKPFGFARFDPGPGTGGHCLPVDPSFLSWKVSERSGRSFRFIELANDINRHMPDYVVQRVTSGLNDRGQAVRGARIVLLGLAYKAGTADARESPAVRVAELLVDLGAEVRAADAYVSEHLELRGVARIDATKEEMVAADAVVLLVDHPGVGLDAIESLGDTFVLDCRGTTSAEHIDRL